MSERDTELKLGRDNLDRMQRLGIAFYQNDDPRNSDLYTFKGVTSRGTPVWGHNEVARCDVRISTGQAQSNHWGYGGGGKLIPSGVCSDETIESNHGAFVLSPKTHYGAMAGPMRSDIDEAATMRDIHNRQVEMWAGCIWAVIYEVMSRKHLTIVTLEENLAMARDIGVQATTSLSGALDKAMARQGPDAKIVVLPFARYQMPTDMIRMPVAQGRAVSTG